MAVNEGPLFLLGSGDVDVRGELKSGKTCYCFAASFFWFSCDIESSVIGILEIILLGIGENVSCGFDKLSTLL